MRNLLPGWPRYRLVAVAIKELKLLEDPSDSLTQQLPMINSVTLTAVKLIKTTVTKSCFFQAMGRRLELLPQIVDIETTR